MHYVHVPTAHSQMHHLPQYYKLSWQKRNKHAYIKYNIAIDKLTFKVPKWILRCIIRFNVEVNSDKSFIKILRKPATELDNVFICKRGMPNVALYLVFF